MRGAKRGGGTILAAGAATALVVVLGASIAACSAQAIVRLTIDLLSYMNPEDTTIETFVPSSPGELVVFLLPGVQVTTGDGELTDEMRAGSLVETPSQTEIASVEPSLAVRAVVTVKNASETDGIANASMALFLAPATASDVYTQGEPAASSAITGLAPLATGELSVTAAIGPDDPAYDDLLAGGVRAGARIVVASGAPTLVPVTLTVFTLTASLAVRPFGLLD